MAGNTFGQLIKLTTFGESHGKAIGGILDGFPAGISVDFDEIDRETSRRKPGQSDVVSQRNESDKVVFLSGFSNGVSLGTPIAFLVWNEDAKPQDYSHYSSAYRPSHADYTYEQKYGIRDVSGGGRSSARETVARVIAGAVCKQMLRMAGIKIIAFVSQIGEVTLEKSYKELNLEETESSSVRCPDELTSIKMVELINNTSAAGDTLGGKIDCIISGVGPGLGDPVFDKLHADLGKAMLSINAVKGFEFGSGFRSIEMKGSDHNDIFISQEGKITTLTNNSGGIQGGISNGNDIYFSVAFKPVSTLMKKQETLDREGNKIILEGKGRHDVCVVPRAVPIVEAMAALVIADHYLRNRNARF